MNLLIAIARLLKLIAALLQRSGAAQQREQDGKTENERIAKAGRAADTVRNDGGVREQDDPNNRDTR